MRLLGCALLILLFGAGGALRICDGTFLILRSLRGLLHRLGAGGIGTLHLLRLLIQLIHRALGFVGQGVLILSVLLLGLMIGLRHLIGRFAEIFHPNIIVALGGDLFLLIEQIADLLDGFG